VCVFVHRLPTAVTPQRQAHKLRIHNAPTLTLYSSLL